MFLTILLYVDLMIGFAQGIMKSTVNKILIELRFHLDSRCIRSKMIKKLVIKISVMNQKKN